jgi:hypothetical protein
MSQSKKRHSFLGRREYTLEASQIIRIENAESGTTMVPVKNRWAANDCGEPSK